MGRLRERLRRRRRGPAVIVVSGLPRSGTSMMMRMLEAGGLEIWSDAEREADEDNPKGYYELERVKELDKTDDKAWVRGGRGRVVKVITHLLRALPDDNDYRVILMRRNLDEVLASQNRMLEHRGEANPIADAQAREAFLRHLADVKVFLRRHPAFSMLEVRYDETVAEPRRVAEAVARFLDGCPDTECMAAEVDATLYRNRQGTSPAMEDP